MSYEAFDQSHFGNDQRLFNIRKNSVFIYKNPLCFIPVLFIIIVNIEGIILMSGRKVAIYARVSTEHEAQISALENQIQYYDQILSRHPDWELYERYIDEGITGTSVNKRKNFQCMLQDAEAGRFDLIITREVSRFARNTVDTLQETRKLRKLGVEVWFTEDNIWTLNDEDGELRLTIMATLAQNESKKISQRVKAGQKISFQNAIPYGTGNILGYDRKGKELVINEEQAKTVKLIFQMYVNGFGLRNIKDELERRGYKTSQGKTVWHAEVIARVLDNPFYCGIVVYRKEYVPDYLEQKRVKNKGEVEQIIVEGRHEPIISKEMYYKAQKIKNERTIVKAGRTVGTQVSSSIWVKKLECACGHNFHRSKWRKDKNTGQIMYGYRCTYAVRHGTKKTRAQKGLPIEEGCDSPMFAEWKLYLMAGMILRECFGDRQRVITIANELLQSVISEPFDSEAKRKEIEQEEAKLKELNQKVSNLLDMRLTSEIDADTYQFKMHELHGEIETIKNHIEKLKPTEDEMDEEDIEKRVEMLKYTLDQKFDFDTYNIPDTVIDALIKKVVVYKDRFEWHLNLEGKQDAVIGYSVDGTMKYPKIQKTVIPCFAGSSTGSYCRGALIHSSLFLGTFEIPKDFMKKSVKIYYNSNRIFQFLEKLEIKLFLV